MAVIVDEDIDVFDEREVWWAVSTRAIADQDFSIIPRVTSTLLNPCSYDETRLERGAMLTYIIIDATKPIDRPFLTRVAPNQDYWNKMRLEDYIDF
jgi:UbiD family decarboxylase